MKFMSFVSKAPAPILMSGFCTHRLHRQKSFLPISAVDLQLYKTYHFLAAAITATGRAIQLLDILLPTVVLTKKLGKAYVALISRIEEALWTLTARLNHVLACSKLSEVSEYSKLLISRLVWRSYPALCLPCPPDPHHHHHHPPEFPLQDKSTTDKR